MAAAEGRGRGEFRASHADREQVIGTLKVAFVEGMLSKDEFDQRVGQAFGSRTHAELDILTDDLQVEPAAARSPARAPGEQPVIRPGVLLAVATGLYAGIWAFAVIPPWPLDAEGDSPKGIILLVFMTTIIYLIVSAIAVGNMAADWLQKRSGRRPPQQPAAGANGR